MAVLINFKICDNDKACSGMAVCPVGVFSWNEEKQSLEIDNSKCINCGACEKACMVNAIRVAKSEEEYEKIKKEIEEDPRTINDLLVERYGGKIIDLAMEGSANDINLKVSGTDKPLIVELFNEESIMCLLKSITVKDIADYFDKETRYRKVDVTNTDLLEKYNVKELPTLLFFKDRKYLGKIEGYYSIEQKDELIKNISDIIK